MSRKILLIEPMWQVQRSRRRLSGLQSPGARTPAWSSARVAPAIRGRHHGVAKRLFAEPRDHRDQWDSAPTRSIWSAPAPEGLRGSPPRPGAKPTCRRFLAVSCDFVSPIASSATRSATIRPKSQAAGHFWPDVGRSIRRRAEGFDMLIAYCERNPAEGRGSFSAGP